VVSKIPVNIIVSYNMVLEAITSAVKAK